MAPDAHGPDPSAWLPAIDVEREDDRLVYRLELPGLSAADISLQREGQRLVVGCSRMVEPRDEGRSLGAFSYTLLLPETVDVDAIEAGMAGGVLWISAPLVARRTRRIVEVHVP